MDRDVATTTRTAEEFVTAFAEAWARPTPERLGRLLHPEVRLIAPMMARTVGLEQAKAEFARVIELIPDIKGEVHGWSGSGDVVFIEFTLSGTFGGRPIAWHAVDRFLLKDGLGIERVSYFDSLPLVARLMSRPPGWGRLWRSGIGLLKSRRLLRRR
jgi:SnoaL-like domain